MQRNPQNIDIQTNEGTLGELRRLLAKIPKSCDALQVWLGADTGEGYEPLRTLLVTNASFCDLDGDVACGTAYEYFNDDPEEPTYKPEEIPAEFTLLRTDTSDGVISAYRDIVVLGNTFASDYVKEAKKAYQKELKDAAKMKEKQVHKGTIKQAMQTDPLVQQLKELHAQVMLKYGTIIEPAE